MEVPAPSGAQKAGVKRKAKVRSAWISFAGRIVAQLVGAVATVGFALVILQKPAADAPANTVERPHARPATIAVLPFSVFAAEGTHDHLADALTDVLVTDLARAGGMSVVSSTSSMRYKGHSLALGDIAGQLGVSYIVEGSLAIAGQRARINAQLIDASSDAHLWARSYERSIDDILGFQDAVAADITREVQGVLEARGTRERANRTP